MQHTYQQPAKSIIPSDNNSYDSLLSDEGTTQGDVAAMPIYGLGIKPLTIKLGEAVDKTKCKQVWYADDSTSGGKITEIRKWWDELCSSGPKYGYFPLPSKTILIVKPEFENEANTLGERHMGAVIGNNDYKHEYVTQKVQKWINDAKIAKDVYTSFNKAIAHRRSYVQRIIPGVSN